MPKKYASNQQRQAAHKASQKRKAQNRKLKGKRILGKYFRWVVPNLGSQSQVRTLAGDGLLRLKQKEPYLQYYCLATEVHPTSGVYHLDAFISYSQKVQRTPAYFDYLVNKHGDLTRYRTLNAGILAYGLKDDKMPVSNFPADKDVILKRKQIQEEPYSFLRERMMKDPWNFNAVDYLKKNNLGEAFYKTTWSKALSLLRLVQQSECRDRLRSMPGIRYISRQLIIQRLTSDQLALYDSWSGYQTIVDKINLIVTYPNQSQASRLPDKTPHLFLVGPSNLGKSALVIHHPNTTHPDPGLFKYFSTYHLNLGERYFPPYTDYMVNLVYWDEFVLNSSIFPKSRYNQFLTYFAGAPTRLPIKGQTSYQRKDNPFHILSSNRTLREHVYATFRSDQSRAMALSNISTRFHEVIIPSDKPLHILRRLFVVPHH